MLREIKYKYQSLINRPLLAQMIQDDFLPIFKMEFKSFEWKNGWMFCEKKDNVKILSICYDSGRMVNLVMVYDEEFKRTRYYFSNSPVKMKDYEGKSIHDIQVKVIKHMLQSGDDNWCVYDTEESVTYLHPIMTLDLIRDEVKYYHVGNLTYEKFSAFIIAVEDFLLIPLYLDEAGNF